MSTEGVPVFDLDDALRRVDGDAAFFREIAEIFLESLPTEISTLLAAVEADENEQVCRLAHRIRGSVVSLGGSAAGVATTRLEGIAGADSEQSVLRQSCDELVSELGKLEDAIKQAIASGIPSAS